MTSFGANKRRDTLGDVSVATLQAVLGRLTVTDPASVLQAGAYVEPPVQSGEELARRFRVDPTGRIAMLGGIGVGKSTSLLVAARALAKEQGVVAHYVDVPLYLRVDALRAGALVALAGLATLRHRRLEGPLGAVGRVDAEMLHVGLTPHPGAPLVDTEFVRESSELPVPALSDLTQIVARLGASIPGWERKTRVLLVDGLDLIENAEGLEALVGDLDALQRLGWGVCMVGSVAWRFALPSAFGPCVLWPVPDPEADVAWAAFLGEVLQRRAGEPVFAPDVLRSVVVGSGGVLRDLIGIARGAIVEALLDGATHVTTLHAARALAEHGRERSVPLDGPMCDVLRRFMSNPGALVPGERMVDLLRRGALLPSGDAPPRFRVHPCLVPSLHVSEAA